MLKKLDKLIAEEMYCTGSCGYVYEDDGEQQKEVEGYSEFVEVLKKEVDEKKIADALSEFLGKHSDDGYELVAKAFVESKK